MDIRPEDHFFNLQITIPATKGSGTKSGLVYYIFIHELLQLGYSTAVMAGSGCRFCAWPYSEKQYRFFLCPASIGQAFTYPRKDTNCIYLLHSFPVISSTPITRNLLQFISSLLHHIACVHWALLCRAFLFRVTPHPVSLSSPAFQILLTKSYSFSDSDSVWTKFSCFIWSPCLLRCNSALSFSSAQKTFSFCLLTKH